MDLSFSADKDESLSNLKAASAILGQKKMSFESYEADEVNLELVGDILEPAQGRCVELSDLAKIRVTDSSGDHFFDLNEPYDIHGEMSNHFPCAAAVALQQETSGKVFITKN